MSAVPSPAYGDLVAALRVLAARGFKPAIAMLAELERPARKGR